MCRRSLVNENIILEGAIDLLNLQEQVGKDARYIHQIGPAEKQLPKTEVHIMFTEAKVEIIYQMLKASTYIIDLDIAINQI